MTSESEAVVTGTGINEGEPMTKLSVCARFILRGVWVHPDACGRTLSWIEDGRQVSIRVPQDAGSFHFDNEPEVIRYPALSPVATIEASGPAVSVDLIRVDVGVEADISYAEWRAGRDAGDAEQAGAMRATAESAWHIGHEIAERAVQRWLAHIRAKGTQPWLGLASEELIQHGRSYIYEGSVESGTLMAFGPLKSLTIRSGMCALSGDELDDIVVETASGQLPGVAVSLLGEALFLAQEAETIDTQRAILSAANACEIKAKEVLRAHATPAVAPLLSIVLSSQSNVSDLTNKPFEAVFGKSLAQVDSVLYKKIQRNWSGPWRRGCLIFASWC